jgi:arabinoxylan arabinofuranohydrolase
LEKNNLSRIRLLVASAAAVALTVLGTLCYADNPIIQTKYTADPAPLVYQDTVYLYTSHDEDDAKGFKMFNWLLYTSTDMVNWTDHGIIGGVKEPYQTFHWADGHDAWAPQCISRNGRFYLYCPTIYQDKMAIGVAVSSSPYGPFVDALGKPLIYRSNPGDYDPTVFIDDPSTSSGQAGQAYLYWGGNGPCYYVKLNEDMISMSGEIRIASIDFTNTPPEASYTEGPWLWKKNGHYYLAWASRCCPEGIGYAMSESPAGPWRCKGTIMDPDALSDGNHPGIIDYKGKSYVFGLNYELLFSVQGDRKKRERRSTCVKEMTYNDDGSIQKVPWWGKGAPVPSVLQVGRLNPYIRHEAETICWSEGIKTEPCSAGGLNVCPIRDGAFIKVHGVNLGLDGAGTFTAAVACGTKPGVTQGGAIELRLGALDGPLAGVVPVSFTGGSWKTETIAVAGAKGVQDLFFVFKGPTIAGLSQFDYWQFTPKTVSAKLVALNATLDRYKIDTHPGVANRSRLHVSAIYSDGTSKDVTRESRIEVRKQDVASVREGVIMGKAPGEIRIEASFGGKTDALSLLVKDLKTEFTASKVVVGETNLQLTVGNSRPVSVTAEFLDGHAKEITGTANYVVENPKVASIKDGVITALDQGSTTIHAEFKDSTGNTLSAPIRVEASFRSPFVRNRAEEFTAEQGVMTETCSEGGKDVCFIQDGDWIRFSALDFGSGAGSVEFSAASATVGGTIEVRLDRSDGPLVGICKVENTGGWQSWVTCNGKVEGVSGRHDVFFKFTGGPGYLFNVNWWRFE